MTTDQEWLDATLRIIPSIGLEACRKLWTETREKFKAAELTEADQAKVLDLLTARMAALKPPADGAAQQEPAEAEVVEDETPPLDPDDPWLAAIEGMGSAQDAEALLDDLADQLGRGEIDPDRAARIEAAIAVRFPAEAGQAVAA